MNILNKNLIFCFQQILNYWAKEKEIQYMGAFFFNKGSYFL